MFWQRYHGFPNPLPRDWNEQSQPITRKYIRGCAVLQLILVSFDFLTIVFQVFSKIKDLWPEEVESAILAVKTGC